MSELKWLDGYSDQSTDTLIALEGKYRKDSLVLAFEQAVGQKAERLGGDSLSDEERIILAVEGLEREVNNGGYHQFFVNSSSDYAPIIVDALNRIGCPETAALTQDAISALEIKGPATVAAINRALDKEGTDRDEKLSKCDGRYFEIAGDLAGPLFEFIKANRARISLLDR